MNGVEILKETAIYENLLPSWLLIALFFTGIVSIIIASAILASSTGKNDKLYWLVFLIAGVISILVFVIGLFPSSHIAYTEYKVTIDDSVSFTEFTEKYEIIDQEGKIYTVKEK